MAPMAHVIRQQISMLVKLQDLELEIGRIQQALSQVNRRTAELDAQLEGFVSAVASGKLRIQELTKSIRARESDLQLNQGRIEKSQEKLRAVKTNKEYQSGLKEIEDLGAIGSKIEDEILAAMEQMEAASAALKESQARMDQEADVIRAEKESVQQEAQRDRLRLERLEAEAADASGRIAADVLALYRRVKAKKANGIAICSVCASVCRGCNVNIPPQMYNELQRVDRLKHCPNCERIIYWDDDQGRSE
jgi:predicted  nucleic acid-binding Zn-ribbon protein